MTLNVASQLKAAASTRTIISRDVVVIRLLMNSHPTQLIVLATSCHHSIRGRNQCPVEVDELGHLNWHHFR